MGGGIGRVGRQLGQQAPQRLAPGGLYPRQPAAYAGIFQQLAQQLLDRRKCQCLFAGITNTTSRCRSQAAYVRRKCLAQLGLARPFLTFYDNQVAIGADAMIGGEQRFPMACAAD